MNQFDRLGYLNLITRTSFFHNYFCVLIDSQLSRQMLATEDAEIWLSFNEINEIISEMIDL